MKFNCYMTSRGIVMSSHESDLAELSQIKGELVSGEAFIFRCDMSFSADDLIKEPLGALERVARIIHPVEISMPMPDVHFSDSDAFRDRMAALARRLGAVVKLVRKKDVNSFGQWTYLPQGWAMFKCMHYVRSDGQ